MEKVREALRGLVATGVLARVLVKSSEEGRVTLGLLLVTFGLLESVIRGDHPSGYQQQVSAGYQLLEKTPLYLGTYPALS